MKNALDSNVIDVTFPGPRPSWETISKLAATLGHVDHTQPQHAAFRLTRTHRWTREHYRTLTELCSNGARLAAA